MAISDPSSGNSELTFHDLFDLEAIQKIQDAFAVATGVASIITDTNGKPITQPSNFCDLCQNVIRKTEKGLANCFKSDAILGQANTVGPTVQPCLSGGLLDGGTSIMAGDQHVANWLIGQVLDESCDIESMKAYASEIGADDELYNEALGKVIHMPRERFEQIGQMLFLIAGQLSEQALLNVQLKRNITERKQVEGRLLKSEERLKRTQEIANLGSWELNLDDNSLAWSDQTYRIFGLDPNAFDASYEAFLGAVHPNDRDAVNKAYTSSVKEGRDYYEIEHRVVQEGSGKILFVHEKCEHVRDKIGNIVRSIGMVHDITARKQKQVEIEHLNAELEARARELEGLNKELEAFNYMIAHDLRKPLTVISGYCQILEELLDDKVDQQYSDYLKKITNSTFNMNQLINAMLDFSQLANSEPKREQVNLSYMANHIIAELRLAEQERKVTFRAAKNIVANVDKVLMQAVMANLLGNAWKFTAKKNEVVIEFGTKENDGEKVYFVRDNGTGFSMDEAQSLFKPFHRLRGADTTTGFGIGLATVERIIHRHGGIVWAEGSLGKGATFYFSF